MAQITCIQPSLVVGNTGASFLVDPHTWLHSNQFLLFTRWSLHHPNLGDSCVLSGAPGPQWAINVLTSYTFPSRVCKHLIRPLWLELVFSKFVQSFNDIFRLFPYEAIFSVLCWIFKFLFVKWWIRKHACPRSKGILLINGWTEF